MRRRPAAIKRGRRLGKQNAVAGERQIVDARQRCERAIKTSTSRRTSGSPPVTRMRRTPWLVAIRAIRIISSYDRISERGNQTGSCGMQYAHLKFAASVTEILKSS
jgi:hypothetical protein